MNNIEFDELEIGAIKHALTFEINNSDDYEEYKDFLFDILDKLKIIQS